MPNLGVRSALLSAFFLASVLPLLVFMVWPHSAALQSQLDEVEERHLVLAHGVADTLSRYNEDVSATFSSLAPLLADGRDLTFAGGLLSAQHFEHLCLVDPATGEVLRAFELPGIHAPAYVPQPLLEDLQILAASGPARMSSTMLVPGIRSVFLAQYIGDRLVVGAVNTEYFQHLAGQISFGQKGHAAIVDAEGRVLAHPRREWVEASRDLSALDPVQRMKAGESGVSIFRSPALKADVIAGFSVLPDLGWGIMVPQPMAELTDKADKIARSALLVFLAGMCLSILLSLAISDVCARGIRRVTRAAQRMARGEESVRIDRQLAPLALTEIEELRWSFNALACQIEDTRRRLIAMAERDSLTGLLNRRAFMTSAQRLLENSEDVHGRRILFYIDVDDFKLVNDVYGHSTGDALLRHIAATLKESSGDRDLIARQSGDEFLVLHIQDDANRIRRFGEELITRLSQPVMIDGQRIRVSCSLGACVIDAGATDLEALINCADQAMYSAKNLGAGQFRIYDEALSNRRQHKEKALAELKSAIENHELRPVFQPILNLRTGVLSGFETLARLPGRSGRTFGTEEFIALGEESGLIHEIGQQIRRQAIDFAEGLAARGIKVPVAVNVSRYELAKRGFTRGLVQDVERKGLKPSDIVLEITESIFDDRSGNLRDALRRLSSTGFGLSLDDFGKGYSSHGLLLSYPFDSIKIDMNFIGDVCDDEKARAIVSSLVDLGRNLQLRIVLEGIETPSGEQFARAVGVTEVQGYFYSRPLSNSDALSFAVAAREEADEFNRLRPFALPAARSA